MVLVHELGEIIDEANWFWQPHQHGHPRTMFFVEDQRWTVTSHQQGIEPGVR
jgi:hypothetical protein